MKVSLFIPCYVDQFYPNVAIATLQLLEKFGCNVHFPANQTCCGQPMANSGFASFSKGCDKNFINNFSGADYIVSPSGSCVLHIKEHLHSTSRAGEANKIRRNVYELTEFLTDVLEVKNLSAKFPHKVGLHISCHGQRMLHLSSMSERVETPFSKAEQLLNQVEGLELIKAKRWDECCGFGGTFCVAEEAVSVQMGEDRVTEHLANDVAFITGGDMSCLMHLEGVLRRQKSPVKIVHLAEILNAQ
ncbi:MAG: (Fe-S)-binding protein [Segetibacter sp.]|nr:(Fe-S)-binding protein [Segetibacter sp.]